MSALSDYAEAAILNHIFRSTTFTKPTTLYIGLVLGTPVDADTGTTIQNKEPTGGSYLRKAVTVTDNQWSVPAAAGSIHNTSGTSWTATGGNLGMVSGAFIADASGGGNIIMHGLLTTPRDVLTGETFTFPSGNIQITAA